MWLPNKSSRVCSENFIDGKPTKENPDPILKMGYEIQVKRVRKSPACREFVPTKRKRRRLVNEEILVTETTQTEPTTETEPTASDGHKSVNRPTGQMEGVAGVQDKTCLETSSSVSTDQKKCCEKSNNIISGTDMAVDREKNVNNDLLEKTSDDVHVTCQNKTCTSKLQMKAAEIDSLKKKIEDLNKNLKSPKKKILSHKDFKNDKTIKAFTGIPNKSTFDFLFSLVK